MELANLSNSEELERQIRLSKLLAVGFVLSILGIGGLGSLAALIIGLQARKKIAEAPTPLAGRRMAWWCIVVGGLGTVIFPALIFLFIVSNAR